MSDELLRPTIAAGVDPKVQPWRLNSQAYVAFFGGVIAATTIAWLNSGRLGVERGKRWLIVATGAVLVWLAQLAALEIHTPQWRFDDGGGETNPDRLVLDLDPGDGAGQVRRELQQRRGSDLVVHRTRVPGRNRVIM